MREAPHGRRLLEPGERLAALHGAPMLLRMTTTTAPALAWISGPVSAHTTALVRGLGCLTMTRGEVLAEHFDDEAEAAQACFDTLLGASVLVHDGRPDPVEVTLARAGGLRILDLS